MSHFNRVAPVYDRLSRLVFGHRLQRAQTLFLDQIPAAGASVLLLGGGTGELLAAILARRPDCHVVYLEPSARMVALATRRVLHQSGPVSVSFRVGDETALHPDEQFDVIITPFVLDLFTEETLQTRFIPRLRSVVTGGIWLVTDFVNTSVWWQRGLLWTMIRFFRLTAGIEARVLANWQQTLRNADLICQDRQSAVWGMVSSEVWTVGPTDQTVLT